MPDSAATETAPECAALDQQRRLGAIVRVRVNKGYCFVHSHGEDFFCHINHFIVPQDFLRAAREFLVDRTPVPVSFLPGPPRAGSTFRTATFTRLRLVKYTQGGVSKQEDSDGNR